MASAVQTSAPPSCCAKSTGSVTEEIAYSLGVAVGTVKSRSDSAPARRSGSSCTRGEKQHEGPRPVAPHAGGPGVTTTRSLSVSDQIAVSSHLERCDECAELHADFRTRRRCATGIDAGRVAFSSDEETSPQARVISRMKAEQTVSLAAQARGDVRRHAADSTRASAGAAAAMVSCCYRPRHHDAVCARVETRTACLRLLARGTRDRPAAGAASRASRADAAVARRVDLGRIRVHRRLGRDDGGRGHSRRARVRPDLHAPRSPAAAGRRSCSREPRPSKT